MRSLIEPLARRQGISLIRLRQFLPNSRQSGSYRLESKGRVRRLLRIALYTASDRPIKPTCPEWLLESESNLSSVTPDCGNMREHETFVSAPWPGFLKSILPGTSAQRYTYQL